MITVLIGKTASGKTRIIEELQKRGYNRIVTTTTRQIRCGEVDGIDYNFVSAKEFKQKIEDEYFAEWKTYLTKKGIWYYGSPLNEFENANDKSVIILTPDGLREVLGILKNKPTVLYIYANNSTIKNRLMERGDSKEEAQRRLEHDNEDFKGAEKLADKIFYNNNGTDLTNLVNKIVSYLEKRGND